jgi:hypothetical protein
MLYRNAARRRNEMSKLMFGIFSMHFKNDVENLVSGETLRLIAVAVMSLINILTVLQFIYHGFNVGLTAIIWCLR